MSASSAKILAVALSKMVSVPLGQSSARVVNFGMEELPKSVLFDASLAQKMEPVERAPNGTIALRIVVSTVIAAILHRSAPYQTTTVASSEKVRAWTSLIITLADQVFPTMLGAQSRVAALVPISLERANEWATLYSFLRVSSRRRQPDLVDQAIQVVADIIRTLGLPPIENIDVDILARMSTIKIEIEFAALLAMIMFAAGKVTPQRLGVSVTEKRPDNLSAKYFNNRKIECLQGSIKISPDAYKWVSHVWRTNQTLRVSVVGSLIEVPRQMGGVAGDLFGTIVGLLRFSDMAHLGVISDFLTKYEWVADMPEISAEVERLIFGVQALAAMPVDKQPFLKLLFGDAAKLCDAKPVARLYSLAIDVMKDFPEHQSVGDIVHSTDGALLGVFVRYRDVMEGQADIDANFPVSMRRAYNRTFE